eukprot:1113383_1
MSAIFEPKMNKYYDFLTHCDDECKNIVTPYINGIERMFCDQHGDNPYYRIPFALKSICSAYYCKHLEYRLSFKALFTQYPTNDHLLLGYQNPHCKHNWQSCPSIQRITHVLSNFQSYLHAHKDDLAAPYVTYRYYQIKQILSDLHHINHTHPQNMVQFYIRNKIIPRQVLQCMGSCVDDAIVSEYNDINRLTTMDAWLKYNLFGIHEQFIHHSECTSQFTIALNHIVAHNDAQNIRYLLSTLKSVAKKFYKKDADIHKYRTLDTTNPEVQRRLMGFEGVLHFLSLLGFESNAIGTKLVCNHLPSKHVVRNAITVIDAYRSNVETQSLEMYMFISNRCHVEDTKVTLNLELHQNTTAVSYVHSEHKGLDASQCVSKSLQLDASDTEYIDIVDQIAVSMDLKPGNMDQNGNSNGGGVMNWFGDKWKRMNVWLIDFLSNIYN